MGFEPTTRGLKVPCSAAELPYKLLGKNFSVLDSPLTKFCCSFDADFAAHLFPSLTTVRVDGADMGRRAAQLVLDRCSGTPIAHKVVDVGFEVVARQSTGPA